MALAYNNNLDRWRQMRLFNGRTALTALVAAAALCGTAAMTPTAALSAPDANFVPIGQPEYVAGKAAGEKAKAAGVKSFLCVNHIATNTVSFDRCRGFADALGVDYKAATLDSGQDPTEIQSKVGAYLRNHPNTDAILT